MEKKKRDTNPDLEKLIEVFKSGDKNEINGYLAKTPLNLDTLNEDAKDKYNRESLLHLALKYKNTIRFFQTVLNHDPKYLMEQRSICDKELKKEDKQNSFKTPPKKCFARKDISPYQGQTPLHVAIAIKNTEAVEMILETAENEKFHEQLLCICAEGNEFKNTVFMGQLPLSVAALAAKSEEIDKYMIEYLISKNAKIWYKNKKGDTVFHSLIKYADVKPDKIQRIKKTFKHLWKCFVKNCEADSSKPTDIFFWENNAGLTPLHLSAKLGVSELFGFIVKIENVYRFQNIKDGIFDIREYDVTEFDRLINYQQEEKDEWKITILESLFDSKCTCSEAFQILNHRLVHFILHRKWQAYKITMILWMILHFTFMSLFTFSMIEKSRLLLCTENSETFSHNNETISLNNEATSCDIGEEFYAVLSMNLVVGIPYFMFGVSCVLKLIGRCTTAFGNSRNFGLMFHNLDYVICLLVIAIGALAECFYIFYKTHSDFHLVLVLISGWYFMLYFSPFSKNLVSFTYMIKSGFCEDFIPFAFVFLWLLVSFTTIMYMLFRGTDNVDEFGNFGSALLTMFNLGVGLNNIDVLNQSRIPWLAYTIFVVFAILSFIHLFNALVAVMSTTFSVVHQERKSYLQYNKLRMIELFEDIVLVRGLVNRLPFLQNANHWDRSVEVMPSTTCSENSKQHSSLKSNTTKKRSKKNGTRYYSVLRLLDDLSEYKDDIDEEKKMKETKNIKIMSKYFYRAVKKFKGESNSSQLNISNPEDEITLIQIQNSK